LIAITTDSVSSAGIRSCASDACFVVVIREWQKLALCLVSGVLKRMHKA
jgi:hypothetical protein